MHRMYYTYVCCVMWKCGSERASLNLPTTDPLTVDCMDGDVDDLSPLLVDVINSFFPLISLYDLDPHTLTHRCNPEKNNSACLNFCLLFHPIFLSRRLYIIQKLWFFCKFLMSPLLIFFSNMEQHWRHTDTESKIAFVSFQSFSKRGGKVSSLFSFFALMGHSSRKKSLFYIYFIFVDEKKR